MAKRIILVCLSVLALAGCGRSESENQDILNNDTPVWQCIQSNGTWDGPTIGGHCTYN